MDEMIKERNRRLIKEINQKKKRHRRKKFQKGFKHSLLTERLQSRIEQMILAKNQK